MTVRAAPIVVPDVDEATIRKLRRQAARNGRSVNEEICRILSVAVRADDQRKVGIETGFASIRAKRRRMRMVTPAKPR